MAVTEDITTPARSGDRIGVPVKAATVIFAGAMVAIDAATSTLVMADETDNTQAVVGRAEGHVDNSAGADGDVIAEVGRGIYRFPTATGGNLIERHDIGADCYVFDDATVSLISNGGERPRAGVIYDVDDKGVWVKFS